jgi:hypothetical protein
VGLDTAFLSRRPLLWIGVGIVLAALGILLAAFGDAAGYPLIVAGGVSGAISGVLAVFAPHRQPPP